MIKIRKTKNIYFLFWEIVSCIIGIFLILVAISIVRSVRRSNEKDQDRCIQNLEIIEKSIQRYVKDKGFECWFTSLNDLVRDGYLEPSYLICPCDNKVQGESSYELFVHGSNSPGRTIRNYVLYEVIEKKKWHGDYYLGLYSRWGGEWDMNIASLYWYISKPFNFALQNAKHIKFLRVPKAS